MSSKHNLSRKAPLPTVVRLADFDANDAGPQPMKNCKPSVKSANAADQFWLDQQDEHEKRAATPAPVDIQEFNKVPRLEENLDKMGALSKIKASATVVAKLNSNHHDEINKPSDNNCDHFNKLRMKDKKRRHKSHTSHSRTRKPDHKSRVTNSSSRQKTIHKSRISKSRYSLVENSKKCRCRYCMRVTNKGTCTKLVLKEASTLTGVLFVNKVAQPKSDTDGSITPAGSANSEYTNTNSHNSKRSSLHSGSFASNISHMSLDHEPMVTNEE